MRPVPVQRAKPTVREDAAPEEVTVVATRRPQLLGDSPSALSVLLPKDIEGREGGLGEAAARVAGFARTNLGPGRDKIMLRGLSDGVFTGRTQSTVGLYLDDTPITYNAPDPDLLLTDMARIEVLKGPQGALYGEGSIAGVVRLVTRKPDLSQTSAMWRASIGLPQTGGLSRRLEGVVNQPLITDRLGVRLVLYDDTVGGYIHDLALNSVASNQSRRSGGRIGLD